MRQRCVCAMLDTTTTVPANDGLVEGNAGGASGGGWRYGGDTADQIRGHADALSDLREAGAGMRVL